MPAKAPLHWLLLGCWLGLLLLLAVPLLLSATASIAAWLMQTIPLLLTFPGVWKLRSRVLLWLAFLVLFYFVNGVLQASSAEPTLRWVGALTVLLCLTVFTAVIVVVRRGRLSRQPPKPME